MNENRAKENSSMGDAVLYFDPKVEAIYDESVKTIFPDEYMVLVQDGKPNLADNKVSKGILPEEIEISTWWFPHMKKPGLFSRKKPFPVKILHLRRNIKRFVFENLKAIDRNTDEVLFTITFEGLQGTPYLGSSFPEKYEKFFKEVGTPYEPGTVLLTESGFHSLITSFANYFLGDLKKYAGDISNKPHIVIPVKEKCNSNQLEFKKKLIDKVQKALYDINMGITINE